MASPNKRTLCFIFDTEEWPFGLDILPITRCEVVSCDLKRIWISFLIYVDIWTYLNNLTWANWLNQLCLWYILNPVIPYWVSLVRSFRVNHYFTHFFYLTPFGQQLFHIFLPPASKCEEKCSLRSIILVEICFNYFLCGIKMFHN